MKSQFYLRAIYIALILFLSGFANVYAQLSVSPSSISTTASMGSRSVAITSSTTWTITNNNPGWLTPSASSGSNGTTFITLTFAENSTTGSRTGSLTVHSGVNSQVVSVTQNGAAAILMVSPVGISAGAPGASGQINITSNTSWTVSADSWITILPPSGSNNASITYTVQENSSVTPRTGQITVNAGGTTQIISVSQTGVAATLNASPTSINADYSGASGQISITSNTSWNAGSNESWITVMPASGSTNGSITYTINENTSVNTRNGSILISGSGVSQVVSITQTGVSPTLTAMPMSISAGAEGQFGQIAVTSNVSWTASSNQPWIGVTPNSASSNGTVSYSITPNPTTSVRNGTITMSGGGLSQSISVTQQGTIATLTVSTTTISVPASGQFGTIAVASNTQWTATSSHPWISIFPPSGSGNANITYSISNNNTVTPRSGSITIAINGLTHTISVSQPGTIATLSLSPTGIAIPVSGAMGQVQVNSNIAWTANSSEAWLSVTPANGFGNAAVTYNASPNNSTTPRNAVITVIAGTTTQTVTVAQVGITPSLIVSSTIVTVSASGESGQIAITSNIDWTVSTSAPWITVTPLAGSGNGAITYTIATNATLDARSGTIIVSGGGIIRTITVTQQGGLLNIKMKEEGAPAFITVTKGVNWIIEPNQISWVSASAYSGSSPSTVTLVAEPNLSAEPRQGTLLIQYTGTAGKLTTSLSSIAPDTVIITQAGLKSPTISSFSPSQGIPGTTITIAGANFVGVSSVKINGSSVATFTVQSPTQITAVVAQGSSGTITVSTPVGTATSAQPFVYETYTAQTLPPVAISMNASVKLRSAFVTLPAPKTQDFSMTVLSTSASGSLVRTAALQKSAAILASESILKVGDTFTYQELTGGAIIFKPFSGTSVIGSGAIQLSAPAGTFADDARILTVNLMYMTTSVRNTQAAESIVAYPNPAIDRINIEAIAEQSGLWNIHIINAMGVVVWEAAYPVQRGTIKHTLDVESLAPGAYFLEVSDYIKRSRTRFIKH